MSVDMLYIAYRKWKEHPCFDNFIGLYLVGFDEDCNWSAPHKILRVCRNLISGKYERFYKYYEEKFNSY